MLHRQMARSQLRAIRRRQLLQTERPHPMRTPHLLIRRKLLKLPKVTWQLSISQERHQLMPMARLQPMQVQHLLLMLMVLHHLSMQVQLPHHRLKQTLLLHQVPIKVQVAAISLVAQLQGAEIIPQPLAKLLLQENLPQSNI